MSNVYEPLAWQVAPLYDTSPVLLLTGSAGGGKSKTAAEKIHAYCMRYPNSFGLITRKIGEALTNSTALFFKESIIGGDKRIKHVRSRFVYPNGSMIVYGGMNDERQREKIRSIGARGGVDIAWMEEANRFTEEDYNEVLARMRGTAAPWRQVILTTNPDSPSHWIYKRLILGGEAQTYYSGAIDNPYNPASYLDVLNKMTGILADRLVRGLWKQAEGTVYSNFNEAVHVIDPFKIPADWQRYVSIDFGYNNAFVVLWGALDGDGRLYVYREWSKIGRAHV